MLEPEQGIVAIGSGGAYAQAAAKALLNHSDLSAADIVKRSLEIAGEICIYTNQSHTLRCWSDLTAAKHSHRDTEAQRNPKPLEFLRGSVPLWPCS